MRPLAIREAGSVSSRTLGNGPRSSRAHRRPAPAMETSNARKAVVGESFLKERRNCAGIRILGKRIKKGHPGHILKWYIWHMNREQTFKEFLSTQSAQVVLGEFFVNMILAAALAYVLGRVYRGVGYSLSNRHAFARNFLPITMTTMLVITIVKSSLALSLGLVGALSIVRFRAAIKEPEELAYLFLAIGIGLGLGAGQRAITLSAFVLICGFLWLAHVMSRSKENENLYVTVCSPHPKKTDLQKIVETLKKHSAAVSLQRFDEGKDSLEAAFVVEFDHFEQLNQSTEALHVLDKDIRVSFLDSKGIA